MENQETRALQEQLDDLRQQILAMKRRSDPLRLIRGLRAWILAAVLLVPLAAYASQISIPNTFVNGTVADAFEVNANFSTLVTESNSQDTRITTQETVSSSQAASIGTNATGIGINSASISALQSAISFGTEIEISASTDTSNEVVLAALDGRTACWVTRASFTSSNSSNAGVNECHAFTGGGSWKLFAVATGSFSSTTCRARCLRW